jgi:formate/nitrite transporter FocA (FNT family)
MASPVVLLHTLRRYIQVLAHKKVSNGWGETLVRAIFANWLVCIATWQANAAQDLTGKAVAIWLPISAFAMLGFEHCIGK